MSKVTPSFDILWLHDVVADNDIMLEIATGTGLLHAWKERGEGEVFSWLQSATSPLDATKAYTLHLNKKNLKTDTKTTQCL